ncbi:hypothetical protein HYV31_04080 [candidate division WWE3 bacterium]|nr:hypothetical protein [candidate division WWE3 bacterium]
MHWLIYSYNDMAAIFVGGLEVLLSKDFFPTIATSSQPSSIDFLSNFINLILFKAFYPVTVANILMILYFALAFIFSFILFKNLVSNRLLALVFALFYGVSNHFLYRIISFTPNIYQTFFFPLTFFLLLRKTKPIFLSFLTVFFFTFSSYYAYFVFICIVLWYCFDELFSLVSLKQKFITSIKNIAIFSIGTILGVFLIYTPVIIQSLPTFKNVNTNNVTKEVQVMEKTYRPIEDFYNLSLRPWYFFIPPQKSLYFAELSKDLYKKIASSNYYLADDYTEDEMGGVYLGWHFLLGAAFVLAIAGLSFGKKPKPKITEYFGNIVANRKLIIKLTLITLAILAISLPPSFTISNITFYTPSYIIYLILPVFRTTVRWAIVIYLVVLILNLFLMVDLYNLIRLRVTKFIFVISLLVVTFVVLSVKLPFIDTSTPPEDIAFLNTVSSKDFSYAVYPKGDYHSIFWILNHKKKLLNPVNFINRTTGFKSNEFSDNLVTEKGVNKLKELGGQYLVLKKEEISENKLKNINIINPFITSISSLESFFERFGTKVFDSQHTAIYYLNSL